MNPKYLLLAFLAIIPAFQSLRAQDNLYTDIAISVTGSIIQETNTSTGATTVKPITIPNILSVLGLTGTAIPAANTLRYYSDETTHAFVIAPRSVGTSGTGTPIALVIGSGVNEINWNPTSHSSIGAGDGIGLSGDLTGTFYESGVLGKATKTDTIKFVAFGKLNGIPTIMKGTAVDASKNLK
jgi:hypothetical protein